MASVLLLVLCIIAAFTSVNCHMAGVEKEPKCSPTDYVIKTLEKLVRMEHAIELMNEKVDNSLKAFREELDLLDDIQHRPSYAFSALWIENTNPSVNDVFRFTRILLNDNDVYDRNTGEFKTPVDGTYTFTANVCVYSYKIMDVQFLADATVIGSFCTGDKDVYSCTSSTAMSQLLKGQIVKLVVVGRYGSGDIVFNRDTGFLSSFSGMLIK